MHEEESLRLQWALSYPFVRPQTPFLFLNGKTWPLIKMDGAFEQWEIATGQSQKPLLQCLSSKQLNKLQTSDYYAVAAIGSNAAPGQLRRKFSSVLNDVCIPVLQINIPNHIVAYANRIAVYGSIPATLIPCKGGSVRVWATLLSSRDYALMNASEDRGEIYDGIPVSPDNLPEIVTQPFEAYTCLSGHFPLLVSAFPSHGSDWPVVNQWEAQAYAIKRLGLSLSVDQFVLENTSQPELRVQRDLELSNS